MFPTTAWSFKISSKRIHRAISRAKGQRGVSPSGKGHSGGIPAFDLCFILFAVQIKISTPKVLPYAALYTELRVRLGSIKHLKWKQASPGAWVLPVCWGRDYDAINLPKAPSLTFQQQLVRLLFIYLHTRGILGEACATYRPPKHSIRRELMDNEKQTAVFESIANCFTLSEATLGMSCA